MNWIKAGITLLLFFVGILITDEIYMIYVQDYNDMYYVSFYLDNQQSDKEFLNDVKQASKRHNIIIYASIVETNSTRSCSINIYGSKYVKNQLEKIIF